MHISRQPFQFWTLCCCAPLLFLLLFWTYQPGLSGPFLFDDNYNIVENSSIKMTSLTWQSSYDAMTSGHAGILKRPISMLSFALNHRWSGLSPYAFKLSNMIIHGLNACIVIVLAWITLIAYRRLHAPQISSTQIQWTAIATGLLWMLHPIQLTSVLYVVQRMTSLSAFFVLLGLAVYLWGRLRMLDGKPSRLLCLSALFICTPLAMLCKENGALLPVFLLVFEAVLFQFQCREKSDRTFLVAVFIISVALPLIAIATFFVLQPQWLLENYRIRDYDLSQRLLTQSRVLFHYLTWIITPTNSALGIFHDDLLPSKNIFTPITTLLSTLGLATISTLLWLYRTKVVLITLGWFFFLAGHSMESSIFPLELVHEHRNYLPMLGIVLPVAYYFLSLHKQAFIYPLKIFAIGLLCILLAANTYSRAGFWSNKLKLYHHEVENHPNSALANFQMGRAFWELLQKKPNSEHFYTASKQYFLESVAVDSYQSTTGLIALLLLNDTAKKPLDAAWENELIIRLKSEPISPFLRKALMTLVDCRLHEICTIPAPLTETLFNAALSNPRMTTRNRASLLAALATHFITMHNNPAAISHLEHALLLEPSNIDLRISMITILLKEKKLALAHEHLILARRHDRLKRYEQQLDYYATLIRNAKH